ncbi:hypothetical protein [Mycolicibacterium farcinogenes]|uniref:hypothetical protein n=1 Tax=Mycobacteriaceae TaxID=1762 RepID=UPI001C8F1923|nr:hypothetical protein [Mycolicibacterium farcinogenes]QZH61222.1 hypothetical protein K1X22_05490 [Mycolicibacterium farcinogenes]
MSFGAFHTKRRHRSQSAMNSAFAAADHSTTEESIAEIGLPWTSLRNGFCEHKRRQRLVQSAAEIASSRFCSPGRETPHPRDDHCA